MSKWLVSGATGSIGRSVLAGLEGCGEEVVAISRCAQDAPGVCWIRGDLETLDPAAMAGPARVVSAGPLDAFCRFAHRAQWPRATRVVAVSSMSAETKAERGHPRERAVAARLQAAESALASCANERGWALSVFRPTLVWGGGDRSITPLLRLAGRLGRLPLPAGAHGRRQPVHAGDLGDALLAAARDPHLGPGPWPMPGGEVLGFDVMLSRALAVTLPQARLWRLPDLPCRVLEPMLTALPGRLGLLAHQLSRARRDLDVTAPTGWERLRLQPRGFQPRAEDFPL